MADLADTGADDASFQNSGDNGDSAPAPRASSGGGRYADEVHSITMRARQRTFYLDLKESGNGKFFKLSEKSRGGRKTTIMFDVEDLPQFIEAFQEMQKHI